MQRTGGSMVEKVYPIDKALSSIFSTTKTAWLCRLVIPALGKAGTRGFKFQASLGSIVRPWLLKRGEEDGVVVHAFNPKWCTDNTCRENTCTYLMPQKVKLSYHMTQFTFRCVCVCISIQIQPAQE